MSFSKFYGTYQFDTCYLDRLMCNEMEQVKYYNLWCEKYNNCFSKCTKDELGEWIIRYYKAIWEMYSSSSIFVESKLHLNNNCFISYYFCLYYSLFHAMNALIYLNPNTPIKTVFRVSHHKLKNVFKSEFCNSKSIFDNTTIELFENLKFKREYFSYNAPMNMVYASLEEDVKVVKDVLCTIYQAIALHSNIAKKEFPTFKYSDMAYPELFIQKFKTYFSNVDIGTLEENLKELKRKRKNEKSRLRRKEEKINIMLENIKNYGKSYSKTEIKKYLKVKM
nr:hypothetical protein [uncultured Blautia sp.]